MDDFLDEKIYNKFVEEVKEKFSKPLPGLEAQLKMAPEIRRQQMEIPADARLAGVMILLFEIDKKWNTILIRRAEDGQTHSGQISFPGGKNEKFDVWSIGIEPTKIEILTHVDGLNFHESVLYCNYFTIQDIKIPCINYDDLLKNKFSSGRFKDLADIEQLKKNKKN